MTMYLPEEYWNSYKQYLDELNESEDFDARYAQYLASFHGIPKVYDIETYKLLMARFINEHKRQQQMNESWEQQKRYWDRYQKVYQPRPDLNGLTTDDLKEGQLNHYLNVERLAALIDGAVRDKLKSELENNLLFYPLGRKEVLGLILGYTLLMIGVSINLTIFVLSQMGKISRHQ